MARTRPTRADRQASRPARKASAAAGVGWILLALLTSACGMSKPLYLESRYAIPNAATGAVQVVVATPADLRPFSGSSNRAPVPSVQGNPADAALTARVVGRRVDGINMLASNIVLPPGESVSQWVGRAVVEGLRTAGIEAELAAAEADDGATRPPRLSVSIHEFWLDVQPSAGLATVEYRVEIALQGAVRGFNEGANVSAQAGVSAGGLDMTLWRRSFDRALEAIAEKTAQQADPLGPRAPQ